MVASPLLLLSDGVSCIAVAVCGLSSRLKTQSDVTAGPMTTAQQPTLAATPPVAGGTPAGATLGAATGASCHPSRALVLGLVLARMQLHSGVTTAGVDGVHSHAGAAAMRPHSTGVF